jgi:hypothetical protein
LLENEAYFKEKYGIQTINQKGYERLRNSVSVLDKEKEIENEGTYRIIEMQKYMLKL